MIEIIEQDQLNTVSGGSPCVCYNRYGTTISTMQNINECPACITHCCVGNDAHHWELINAPLPFFGKILFYGNCKKQDEILALPNEKYAMKLRSGLFIT